MQSGHRELALRSHHHLDSELLWSQAVAPYHHSGLRKLDELQAYAQGSDIGKRGEYLEVLNRLCIFALMKEKLFSIIIIFLLLVSCKESYEHKTVICIPVYGQSLALGEEATRITDFDSLASYDI